MQKVWVDKTNRWQGSHVHAVTAMQWNSMKKQVWE